MFAVSAKEESPHAAQKQRRMRSTKVGSRRPRCNELARRERGRGGGLIKPIELDANTKAAVEELQRYLGTKVYLRPKAGTRPGQLILEFYDDAQLAEIYDRLMR